MGIPAAAENVYLVSTVPKVCGLTMQGRSSSTMAVAAVLAAASYSGRLPSGGGTPKPAAAGALS